MTLLNKTFVSHLRNLYKKIYFLIIHEALVFHFCITFLPTFSFFLDYFNVRTFGILHTSSQSSILEEIIKLKDTNSAQRRKGALKFLGFTGKGGGMCSTDFKCMAKLPRLFFLFYKKNLLPLM